MARKRMIDPHIWEDPGFNGLSLQARLLFIGMVSNADDYGYLRADAGSLKRLIFGFDDAVKKDDVADWIVELCQLSNIHFYEVAGEYYAHFVKWDTYQKQQRDRLLDSVYPVCNICLAPAEQSLTEVKGSKGKLEEVGKVKKSEVKGSAEGEPVDFTSPAAPSRSQSKALQAINSAKAISTAMVLFLLLAFHTQAQTIEIRYEISTPKTTTSKKSAPPPKKLPARSVQKIAGESAKRVENTSYLPQQTLNDLDIARMIKAKSWPYSIAIRLAKSENYWNQNQRFECDKVGPINKDGSYDVGLFQINTVHIPTLKRVYGWTMEDMKDCKKNITFAHDWLFAAQGWNPWSAYNNGSYLNHSEIQL